MSTSQIDELAEQIALKESELEALRRERAERQDRLNELSRRKQELEEQLRRCENDIKAVEMGTASAPGPTASRVPRITKAPKVMVDASPAPKRGEIPTKTNA